MSFDELAPKVIYNKELYTHIKNTRKEKLNHMLTDLVKIGSGAAGITYLAYVLPREQFSEPIVIKEQSRNKYCNNEYEALCYLRDLMLMNELPGYYIFTYGSILSGNKKYLLLEKADIGLDTYLTKYNASPHNYLYIYYHVANAVSYLEKLQFNHGDLWCENVMLTWHPDQFDVLEHEKRFHVKIIDYDSSFKKDSLIKTPSLGGADKHRTRFILGYDLNRFFDSLIYAYESYTDKKRKWKSEKIKKALEKNKRGKNVHVPSFEEIDTDDEEFDAENIIYPPSILELMYALGPSDPNEFADCPDMSGDAVKNTITKSIAAHGLDVNEVLPRNVEI